MLVLTDNMLSCQDSIYDYVLSNKIAAYTYLGTDTVVRITYEQPSIRLDLWGGTSGTFNGLDRFNRIIDQLWQNNITTTPAAIDEYQYGYDQNSNRTYKANVVGTAAVGYLDEGYSYDNLNRLTTMQRGNLSSGVITGTPAREMDYTLDPTGNWSAYLTKTSGTTDLSQTRTANKVNEITAIGGTPGWATPPAYDAAGNMTSFPQPASPSSTFTATYDAWNRMTSISAGGTALATYQYDGQGRRIVKYTAATSETRHFYYTNDWQDIEERVGTATTMDKQYVWGIRYIDELVCRDDAASTPPRRLYAMQDANFNLTGITNTSGGVVERYLFDPYGTRAIMNASWGTISSSTYGWVIGHQGLIHDEESGLVYNRARVLSPLIGIFASRDPFSLTISSGLYQYVSSNPIVKLDPLGEDELSLIYETDPATIGDLNEPYNAISAKNISAILADLKSRLKAGDCVKFLTISGHGGKGGGDITFGGSNSTQGITGGDITSYLKGALTNRNAADANAIKTLQDLQAISKLMCDDSQLEFATCHSGEGQPGQQLLKGLQSLLKGGPKIWIKLYKGDNSWQMGLYFLEQHWYNSFWTSWPEYISGDTE